MGDQWVLNTVLRLVSEILDRVANETVVVQSRPREPERELQRQDTVVRAGDQYTYKTPRSAGAWLIILAGYLPNVFP